MTNKSFRIGPEPEPFFRPKKERTGRYALAGLALLGAAALFVVVWLPDLMGPTPTAQQSATPREAEQKTPGPVAQDGPTSGGKAEAEKQLSEALRALAKAEGEGVRIWGAEPVNGLSIEKVDSALERARNLLAQKSYSPALVPLAEAVATLKQLDESKTYRFDTAMEAGRRALDARDAATAEQQFNRAAAARPGDPAAEAGRSRAQKLPETLRFFEAGAAAERSGAFETAVSEFQKAISSDPEFEPAQAGLRRVEASARELNLKRAISDVHARLSQGDSTGAEAALARANRISPASPEVRDLQKRVAAAVQTAKLEALRKRAEDAEANEKWPDALKVYEEALALDPNVAFAEPGRARARALIDLHRNIDSYLEQPSRLLSAGPLKHAAALLAASQGQQDGPVLSGKKMRLHRLISDASRPVPVTIRSDRNTNVEIYRVGLLGLFETHRIELPPGKYVAVGARNGYRDVRVEFEVKPASNEEVIVVKCTEAIR